nr:DUF1512 family protein [Candidatus Freyarchaeota archaeon]
MDGQNIWEIISFLVYMAFCFFCIYQREIMLYFEVRKIRKQVREISKMIKETRSMLMSMFDERLSEEEREKGYDKVMNYFVIAPIETDPSGVMDRLEYLLDAGDETLGRLVEPLCPDGDLERLENLKQMFREAIVLNRTFKLVREIYLSSKKSRSLETVMQTTMNLPLLLREARIRFKAVKAYVGAEPIGNGVAPLVVSKLMDGSPFEVRDGVVISEREYEGRELIIIKPKGPGARSRNVGRVAADIIMREEKIAGVVVISAQVKLEGEKSVVVTPATGVAFVSEPEKYRLEELASEKKIPLVSLVVKMSNEEYYTKMSEKVRGAVPKIVERFEDLISGFGEGKVILIGSGNTMAITP